MEVYHNGEWGRVCDDGWDLNDAQVVCRELGYGASAMHTGLYGQGSGQIWLNNVNCVGTEDVVTSCTHSGWGYHDCFQEKDASVRCSSGDVTAYYN